MTQQKPSLGRVVHFVAGDGQHLAATISQVYTPYSGTVPREPEEEARRATLCEAQAVDVHVLYPDHQSPMQFVEGVRYDEAAGPLSWHWPEREG
ncbi:hypothetical protein GO986_16155 [Deinococcus sp. HMF7620]|uniref:Uncharacterized protein n=1 Tax=Deinococcus arboris TaxID=2682977 RepID=A0A7C9MAD4_9DEIO|nr:hypothetical protein [Deinococcus arboris]MVN88279.1 hypothetical protein [Deinococcus arboris]